MPSIRGQLRGLVCRLPTALIPLISLMHRFFLAFPRGKVREGEKKKERGNARFEYADRHNPNHAVARKLPFQRSKRFLFSIVSTTNAFRPFVQFLHFHLEGSRRDSKCAISHFY